MRHEHLDRIAERLRTGEEKAFDELYDATYKAVFVKAYSVLKDRMKAEDVLQETYLTIYNKIGTYVSGTNFLAWILTIAGRLAINEYHRLKRETPAEDDYLNVKIGGKGFDGTENWLVDAAGKILEQDEFEIVMAAVMGGYRRREIAEVLGLPVSTVSWKYKKGLEKLKKYLEEKAE